MNERKIACTLDGKGNLNIDLSDLAESLTDNEKQQLAKHLAFSETLFRGVLDSVSSEYGGMWEGDLDGGWNFDPRTVQEFREMLIPLLPTSAQETIRFLIKERRRSDAIADHYRNLAWKLHREWPMISGVTRPDCPQPNYLDLPSSASDQDVANELRRPDLLAIAVDLLDELDKLEATNGPCIPSCSVVDRLREAVARISRSDCSLPREKELTEVAR